MPKRKTPASPQPVTVPASTRQRPPSLAQTRLAGASDNLRCVRRHRPAAPASPEKRQAGLASFGFSPVPAPQQQPGKRRGRQPPPAVEEVPETQFAQVTQSPGFDLDGVGNTPVGVGSSSSPLLPPPPPLPEEISAMPPPPVTPKRRRVLVEIPDSKSPPTTPFSPFQRGQSLPPPQLLVSPTSRLGTRGSPFKKEVESGDGDGPMVGRRLFTAGPGGNATAATTTESTGLHTHAPAPVNGGGRKIDSSQWWEVEEEAPLSTQATQSRPAPEAEADTESQESIATVILPHPHRYSSTAAAEEEDPETFRVDLTYKEDLLLLPRDTPEPRPQPESQSQSQGSFHSMTYPLPPAFRDSTPEPELPPNPDPKSHSPPPLPASQQQIIEDTASEEDPEDGDVDDAPHYRPYRTQQLPSSFMYTAGTYPYPQSQSQPQESQWVPDAVRGRYGPANDPSQWKAPEIVPLPRDDEDEDEQQQASQVLPGAPPEEEEDITIATSQLLPSELMETFPMPPPLSQYSSYGYGDMSFGSETQ